MALSIHCTAEHPFVTLLGWINVRKFCYSHILRRPAFFFFDPTIASNHNFAAC